jgi:hypothetical protein
MGGGAAMAELKLHDRCGSSPRGRGVGEEEGRHGCEEEEKEREEREKKRRKERKMRKRNGKIFQTWKFLWRK